MWGFDFSVYGTAALAVILLASGGSVWVLGANARHHYAAVRTGIGDSAVALAKREYPIFRDYTYGTAPRTLFYWLFPFIPEKRQFALPFNAFVSDAVYHVANTMHELAYRQAIQGKKGNHRSSLLEGGLLLVLCLLALNTSWALVLSAWGVVAICAGLLAFAMIVELSVSQRVVNETVNTVRERVLSLSQIEAARDIRKYCRSLKLRSVKKYLLCFLQPYIDLGIMLWRSGRGG